MALAIQDQPVTHAIEQISPELSSSRSFEDDALLQPRQYVVVDAVPSTRVSSLTRCIDSDAYLTADQHIGQNRIVSAMIAHDADDARPHHGISPKRTPPRVIETEADPRAVCPILQEGVTPAVFCGERGAEGAGGIVSVYQIADRLLELRSSSGQAEAEARGGQIIPYERVRITGVTEQDRGGSAVTGWNL